MIHKAQIQAAHKMGQLVRIYHAIDPGCVDGYVVDAGAECFLLEVFDETIRLNGFSCLRYADVDESECPSTREAFLEKVVRLRGLQRAPVPVLELTTLRSAIESARKLGLLVSLHISFNDPVPEVLSNVAYVGKVLASDDLSTSFLCLDAEAVWDEAPVDLPTAAIFRLDVGGGYEEALLLVSQSEGGPELTS